MLVLDGLPAPQLGTLEPFDSRATRRTSLYCLHESWANCIVVHYIRVPRLGLGWHPIFTLVHVPCHFEPFLALIDLLKLGTAYHLDFLGIDLSRLIKLEQGLAPNLLCIEQRLAHAIWREPLLLWRIHLHFNLKRLGPIGGPIEHG